LRKEAYIIASLTMMKCWHYTTSWSQTRKYYKRWVRKEWEESSHS